jgi:Flp pilus assembly pilin Flp
MIPAIGSFFRRYLADERGATAAIVAISMVSLIGTAALATDMGYLYTAQLKLQSSADAAALAGAQFIIANNLTTSPVTEATSYSGAAGDKNAQPQFTASLPSAPALKCLTTLVNQADPCVGGFPGAPSGGANAIQVVENGQVPSFFAKVFGIQFFNISATATAAAKGGQPKPLWVEIVLDTTASMGGADNNCGLGNSTRIACARDGVQTLLKTLSPSVQHVGLMVFPGFTNSSQAVNDTNCSGVNPAIAPYYSSPAYSVVSFSTDYRTSNSSKTLNTGSPLANASGGNKNCPGVAAPGGDGTYYAQAIAQAQALLAADGAPTAQQAIIFLSDGEANATNEVQTVTLTGGGSGYSAAPTVTFTAPTGSAEKGGTAGVPTVTVTMATGQGSGQHVASITLNTKGGGYTSTPTVTFSNPTGKNGVTATATATLTSPPGLNQCHQAITAAQAATAAATQVYTIAYGSSTATSGSTSCSTDTPPISPCSTLEQMASVLANFYSDGSGGTACPNATSVTSLAAAFQSIASSITSVRLIPNNTL